MKKVKGLQANNIYLISSKVTANSTYIEDEKELDIFWTKFNQYMSKYVDVMEHIITASGFQLIIKVKKEAIVMKEYVRTKIMKFGSYELREKETWRILSERIQLFLGRLVREINGKRKCKGSRTRNRFERYIFDSEDEMIEYMKKMKEDRVEMDQEEIKYCGIKSHYTLDKEDARIKYKWNSRWCKEVEGGGRKLRGLSYSYGSQRFSAALVVKLLKDTIYTHFPKKSQKSTQNILIFYLPTYIIYPSSSFYFWHWLFIQFP